MAVKKIINIDVRTEKSEKDVKKLNSTIKQSEDQVELTKKASDGLVASLDRMTGGAVTAFKGIVTGAKLGARAMGTLKLAIISTGIGALLIAAASLVVYFTKTQRGADLISKAFAGLGATIDVLVDRIAGFGEGLALIFSGKYQEGADKLRESFKGIGEEIKNESKAAYDLDDALKKVEDREIALIEVNAKKQAKIENLRLETEELAKTDKKAAAEKLKQAIELENQITNSNIKIAKEKARISKAQLGLGESTRDERRANAELQASVINLEAARDKSLRTVQTRLNAFTVTQKDSTKATGEVAKAQQEAIEAEEKRIKSINDLRDKLTDANEDLRAKEAEDKLALERERAQEELDALIGNETEKREAQIELDLLYNEKEKELAEQRDQEKKDADKLKTESERAQAEERKNIAEAEKDAKQDIQNAYLNVAMQGINVLKQVAGENKKVQAALLIAENAAGIAKIVVNTAAANAKAVAAFPLTLGMPWVGINTVSAGIGIAGSIAATVKGLRALGQSGGGGGSSSVPQPRTAAPPTPSFNLVGNSQANQLAGALNQNNQPVQAYVVSRDMTSQQEMDRNIRRTASVG